MCSALADLIAAEIRAGGPMDVGRYMALCLGHPEYGYYMTRDPLGVAGDFTTAPEISQMFGEMIGGWLADAWDRAGHPSPFVLLECGPGRGTLMADALRAVRGVPGFVEAAQLHLLETSPVLRESQARALAEYDPVWHDGLDTVPGDVPLFVVANEFLDALPVRQLVRRGDGWAERCVALENDSLRFVEMEANSDVCGYIAPELFVPEEGAVVEVAPERERFLGCLYKTLLQQGGVALFCDYGYGCPGYGDTVQAVRGHGYASVLEAPGEADLTAHVNFSDVSRLALEAGLTVHGSTGQGDFLRRLGIDIRVRRLMERATEAQSAEIETALERLCGDRQMGRLFKVMAVCSDPSVELVGFA